MKQWNQRPLEIRNLFNPAFCGIVLFRSFCGYEEQDTRGIPFSLSLLILPLCLHKDTRHVILQGNKSYFLKIVSNNQQLLINFGKRTTDLLPFTFEALGFLMKNSAFTVNAEGRLRTSATNKVRKSLTGTQESIDCQRAARYLGKEFAKIADRGTIYTTLGVKP